MAGIDPDGRCQRMNVGYRPKGDVRDWSVVVLSCIVHEGHDGRNPEDRGDPGRRRRRLQPHGERGRGPHAGAAEDAARADLTRPARQMPLCDALAGGAELATTVSATG